MKSSTEVILCFEVTAPWNSAPPQGSASMKSKLT